MLPVLRPALALLACLGLTAGPRNAPPAAAAPPRNLLLVVLDDVGADKIGAYGHPGAGPTPTLDAIAAAGVSFRRAWAMPVCSPTRASLLTGRLPGRTGVGISVNWLGNNGAFSPDGVAEVTLADVLSTRGYRCVHVGKWHLAQKNDADAWTSPISWGFQEHRGLPANPGVGGGTGYKAWIQNTATAAGSTHAVETGYITTRQVDDALDVIEDAGATPWFVMLALSAAHKPLDKPPAHLHTQGSLAGASDPESFRAVLEAADTELLRLFTTIRPETLARTWVIVLGDNGCPATVTAPLVPDFKAKGSTYEPGVRVPFMVWGPGVAPGWSDALVSVTDVFATAAELLGLPATGAAVDSVSFAGSLRAPHLPGARETAITTTFEPLGFGPWTHRVDAARDTRWKLMRTAPPVPGGVPTEAFFDLLTDPSESLDLLAAGPLPPDAQAAWTCLSALLDATP